MSYGLIKYYFESGVFNLKKMVEQVDLKNITEEQFHFITGYSYRAIKGSV